MGIFFTGIARRVVSSHAMNAVSSRSHCILGIDLALRLPDGSGTDVRSLTSRIMLVDLAGSERVSRTKAEGSILDESISINKSLFVLRQVIKALADFPSGSCPQFYVLIPFLFALISYDKYCSFAVIQPRYRYRFANLNLRLF